MKNTQNTIDNTYRRAERIDAIYVALTDPHYHGDFGNYFSKLEDIVVEFMRDNGLGSDRTSDNYNYLKNNMLLRDLNSLAGSPSYGDLTPYKKDDIIYYFDVVAKASEHCEKSKAEVKKLLTIPQYTLHATKFTDKHRSVATVIIEGKRPESAKPESPSESSLTTSISSSPISPVDERRSSSPTESLITVASSSATIEAAAMAALASAVPTEKPKPDLKIRIPTVAHEDSRSPIGWPQTKTYLLNTLASKIKSGDLEIAEKTVGMYKKFVELDSKTKLTRKEPYEVSFSTNWTILQDLEKLVKDKDFILSIKEHLSKEPIPQAVISLLDLAKQANMVCLQIIDQHPDKGFINPRLSKQLVELIETLDRKQQILNQRELDIATPYATGGGARAAEEVDRARAETTAASAAKAKAEGSRDNLYREGGHVAALKSRFEGSGRGR